MFSLTYTRHRRLLVWAHWVVACMAGCGGFMGLIEIIQSLDRGPLPPQVVGLTFLVAAPTCLFAMVYSQQLILCRSGIPAPFWTFASLGGVAAGLFVSCLATEVFASLLYFLDPNGYSLLKYDRPLVWGFFACTLGATIGFVQTLILHRPVQQHVAWIITNGLAFGLVSYYVEYLVTTKSLANLGLFVGLTYGATTGTCLVWLLPTLQDVAAEQCYQNWLAQRRWLPRRLTGACWSQH